ncbi:nitrous oxide reductase accessory protein NosL [Paenibacillus sp. y28]|uniref:nitrous oxide reductase accessory protein NosL n=1 Tax=Paenibacillus sp. y28 TaxID=3129110 RepID=UPI00301882F3
MKKTGWLIVLVLTLAALLTACGEKKYAAVPINEETDKCAICNMQIKDDAFAVQLTTTDGKNYKFDDLGCMNEWKTKNQTASIGAQFVRDYNNKEWISYEEAAYVYDASFKSPMAYGIYSFKDAKEAQKFIDEQKKGKLMTAADLSSHTWQQNVTNMGGSHGHDASSHSETSGHNNSAAPDAHNKGAHAQ